MQPAVRGDVLQLVFQAAMDTTSMELVQTFGAATRQAYTHIWDASTRFMSPEYVHLIEALAGFGKALFPLQMSVFERLSNGRPADHSSPVNMFQPPRSILLRPDAQPQDAHVPMEERRRVLRDRTERFASAIRNRTTEANITEAGGDTDSTADSWRTRIPVDEVSGEEGWESRATEAIRDVYGYDVADEVPGLDKLKKCLREAMQASLKAEERVRQLLTIRANAMRQKNSVRELLRANGQAVTAIQSTADTAVKALTTLADDVVKAFETAREESAARKQQLYVLQKAWSTALGGNASLVPLCGICLQRGVDVVCTPCGHTFCEACAIGVGKQPNSSRYTPAGPCHVCRGVVQAKQKMYFS